MPAKKYHVELSVEDRATLEQMLRRDMGQQRRTIGECAGSNEGASG